MSTDQKKKVDPQFILQNETPVIELNAADAFEKLTDREKLYAHYLSKGSWYGSLICLVQVRIFDKIIFLIVILIHLFDFRVLQSHLCYIRSS